MHRLRSVLLAHEHIYHVTSVNDIQSREVVTGSVLCITVSVQQHYSEIHKVCTVESLCECGLTTVW